VTRTIACCDADNLKSECRRSVLRALELLGQEDLP
jgi:hypothetical protein